MMNELTKTTTSPLVAALGDTSTLPAGLRLLLDEDARAQVEDMAKNLANAKGITPPHLLGQTEACFYIVQRSLTWRLDPYTVALSTFQTPGGRIGFEGKLIQAILQASGHLQGGLSFEHIGNWSKVQGKFQKKKSDKGKEYYVPAWSTADEDGLAVKVSASIKGESKPRSLEVKLVACQPRYSTLWATSPEQQICYRAARMFANLVVPDILMGVPWSDEPPPGLIEVAGYDVTDVEDVETVEPADEGEHELMAEPFFAEGRTARTNNIGFRNVPGEATPLEAEYWREGWQYEDRQQHGEPEPEPEPEEEKTGAAAMRETEIQQAYAAGVKARDENKAQKAVPWEIRDESELADAYQRGWAKRDKELASSE